LSVLQLVLSTLYRLFLYDPNGLKDTAAGGNAWMIPGLEVPFLLPLVTTLVWLAIFFILLNDEDKDAAPDRMYHVYTVQAAGTHTPGKE